MNEPTRESWEHVTLETEWFPLSPEAIKALGGADAVMAQVFKEAINRAVQALPQNPETAKLILLKAWNLYQG